MTTINTVQYLTADDAPITTVAAVWLDQKQAELGGVRGYGGTVSGQWLRLLTGTRVQP